MFGWAAEDALDEPSIEKKEEEFYNVVRVYIIALLTLIGLYIFSYWVISKYHQKRELYAEDEDARVYRISFHLCAFTIAVSIASVLLLPMSMLGNEVVHLYPESYWVQWLNGALVHTFWEYTFVLSNISLFGLLPFSYFFTESEGFSGQRRGLMPRVYETITVLFLVALLVFGLAVLVLAFIDNDESAQGILIVVSKYCVQYLYSFLLCICILLMISACAPFGFSILFDAVGHLLVKPNIFENNDNRIMLEQLEEDAIKRKINSKTYFHRISSKEQSDLYKQLHVVQKTRKGLQRRKNASALEKNLGYPLVVLVLVAISVLALILVFFHILKLIFIGDHELHPSTVREGYIKDYRNFNHDRTCEKPKLEVQPPPEKIKKPSRWWRLWSYNNEPETNLSPTEAPTIITETVVKSHLYSLGAASLSRFGIVGTILEVLIILYLMLTSVVGFYNLPGFKHLRPQTANTTMTKIILNCLFLQLLSSSLPVLSRVLGITDFELQGNFGKFYWLGNVYIVFAFNVIYAAMSALSLVNKLTHKMRTELIKALRTGFSFSHVRSYATSRGRISSIPSSPFLIGLSKSHTVTEDSTNNNKSAIESSKLLIHNTPESHTSKNNISIPENSEGFTVSSLRERKSHSSSK